MIGSKLGVRRKIFAMVLALGAILLIGGQASAQQQDCKRPAGGKVHVPKIVNFDFDSTEIKPEYREQLDELARRFAGNPNVEVCLVGMTDRVGDAAYNKKLALRRASAVADYLKQSGLASNKYQMVARGQAYGDDSWIGQLLGSKPQESNRRVDVLIMER